MEEVYQVWHFRVGKDEEFDWDEKTQVPQRFGVYSTEANAQAAVERLKQQPEFASWPDGFQICPIFLDQDRWDEGFITYYYPIDE